MLIVLDYFIYLACEDQVNVEHCVLKLIFHNYFSFLDKFEMCNVEEE